MLSRNIARRSKKISLTAIERACKLYRDLHKAIYNVFIFSPSRANNDSFMPLVTFFYLNSRLKENEELLCKSFLFLF